MSQKLNFFIEKGDLSNLSSEEKSVLGQVIQTVGTTIEAIGFTKQTSDIPAKQIEGRRLAITGNWLKAYGASLEAIGETELLKKDLAPGVPF